MYRKLSLVILLIISGISIINAGEVSKKTATLVAKNFYYERVQQIRQTDYNDIIPTSYQSYKIKSEILFHIIGLNDQGFVLVAAEDNVLPVFGYSFEGTYSGDNIPPQMVSWLENFGKQIAWNRQNKTAPDQRATNDWDRLKTNDPDLLKIVNSKSIQPLLISTWDQGSNYNALCPADPDGPSGHVYAGCVATAMAQVMYYYRYPETGTGSNGYYSSYGYLSANFGSTSYDWNSMLNSLQGGNVAVATLLSHCGIAVDMGYSPTGSGAYSAVAADALVNFFGYSSNLDFKDKDNYSSAAWSALLRQNLDNKRPIYYHGYGSGGHAFNVDGYQYLDYFHFNWGWSGSYNGYFYLDNLNPGGNNFTDGQGAIVDIYPAASYPEYCQGTINLTNLEGTIEDGSGPGNYLPNGDCRWVIDPQSASGDSVSEIKLYFNKLQTEAGQDIISIYNGSTVSDPVLYTFSGDTTSFLITIPSNKVLIRFTTNSQNENNGWFVTYKCTSPEYCHGVDTRTELSGIIEDGSGNKNYSNGTICQFLIMPPDAQTITLHFEQFNVSDSGDFVEVYEFDTITATGDLLGRYSGNTIPPDKLSQSGAMYLIFYSNSSITSQGWKASYTTQQVGIEENKGLKSLSIYPNPVNDLLSISLGLEEVSDIKVEILSQLGNQLMNNDLGICSGELKHTFDTSSLSAGIYCLRIILGEKSVCRKFVVE